MCPGHRSRTAPLLGAGSIAEGSVAAADADGVDLARGAEGLVAGGGDQARGRGGAGLAVHDPCDTQQGLLRLRGTPHSRIPAQKQLQSQLSVPQSTAGAQDRHPSSDRTNSLHCRSTAVALPGIALYFDPGWNQKYDRLNLHNVYQMVHFIAGILHLSE